MPRPKLKSSMHRLERVRRGDTIIEVMFAIAIFSLVALLSVSMMNGGVNSAQTALELSTARSELNAQAEVLRFAHASYNTGGKALWDELVRNAITAEQASKVGILDLSNYLLTRGDNNAVGCDKLYAPYGDDEKTPLQRVNAFVVNTRAYNLSSTTSSNYYLPINDNLKKFRPSQLGARIVYQTDDTLADSDYNPASYSKILAAEGIWAFAVKGGKTEQNPETTYYDFYLGACWYGPGAKTPSTLDTVIRLYDPEAM